MIPKELEGAIIRFHLVEKWPVGTIARHLHVHHGTVERVLRQSGLPVARKICRPSIVDPYRDFITESLKKHPRLQASRLYQMIKQRGYPGGPDHFRHIVACMRPPPPAEAYLRLRTLPGEQAQVDWGHFGKLTIGRGVRPLQAFVMVLSWSRKIFLRFFLDQRMSCFLTGHVEAFSAFGGVPRVCLYDNLRSAVLERRGEAIRFNPTLLDFAAHYRYEPRPVAPYRGNEKGRVERAIRYVRGSFFAARSFEGLDDLNRQAKQWSETVADDRLCPEDRSFTVREAFQQERPRLLDLPGDPFPTEDRVETRVRKTPYVRYDRNDYSVPAKLARRPVVVLASERKVRILDGDEVVAVHERSFDTGAQIEDPAHLAELVGRKREAREARGLDRLHQAAPSSGELMVRLAERGSNLGSATASLLRLLAHYGPIPLEEAIAEALEHKAPHPSSVRHILERNVAAQGRMPILPLPLPEDPRVRNLIVRPHDLGTYDALKETDEHDQKQDE